MTNKIYCPFCDSSVFNEDNSCDHLFQILDSGYETWKDEFVVFNNVDDIVQNYVDPVHRNEMDLFLKGLKIKKYVSIKNWDDFSFLDDLEIMSKDIIIIDEDYDFDRPGASGVYKYVFIKDSKNVQWIINDFQILYKKLLKYDSIKMKLFL